MPNIFTSLCKKHPELLGERHGHNHVCVGCRREQNAKRAKERYASDIDYRAKVIAKVVEHGQSNVEARRERANRSYALNKSKYAARKAAHGRVRKHHLTYAQPSWADKSAIIAVYQKAKDTGMTVDHIVPLIHPKVCGLHVSWNLRVVPLADNLSKGNKFDVS